MNNDEPFFDPEDPALTAYALGELTDPTEHAAMEQILRSSPEARDALREIRALTSALRTEYDQERLLASAPAATGSPSNVVAMTPAPRTGRPWPRRLLLAAALLLLLASVARLMVSDHAANRASVPAASGRFSQQSVAVEKTSRQEPPPKKLAQASPADAKPAESAPPVALAAVTPATPPGTLLALASTASGSASGLASADATKDDRVQASPLKATPPAPDGANSMVSTLDLNHPDSFASGNKLALSGRVVPAPPVGVTADQNRSDLFAARDKHASATRFIQRKATPYMTPYSNDVADGSPQAATRNQSAVPSAVAALGGADRVIVSGANIPTSEEVGVAPVDTVDQLSTDDDSQVKGFRRHAAGTPFPANAKRGNRSPVFDTATYEHLTENPFLAAKDNPLSTFSIDVDTASYANVRRFIESGRLPPPDAVRIEELINYFPYHYAPPAPDDEQHPFAVHLEAAACPWNPTDRLVRIGIKGRELARDKRPPSNLVFLLDVSGSMEPPERLPLIKASLHLLVEQLTEDDRVAIVTYAGESGVALPPTTGDHKEEILHALDKLEAGGSTNGASGIKRAYQVARAGFIPGGTNRVILATDGDFNVGVTSQGDLVRLIEQEARSGVSLSALGVGTDNYKDATMQKLADKGHGNYAYIDRLDEARKVLVEQMSGTLVTIAKDVKIQVEFNPATVAAYRLVGYEKRMLRKEDFNDDRIDAGEIGAGHSVTALYEVVPAGQSVPQVTPKVDTLRYGNAPAASVPFIAVPPSGDAARAGMTASHELLTVKMRHKAPEGDRSEHSYEESLTDHGTADDFANASPDFKFAAAVASFGLVLRDSPYKGGATLGAALELAQDGRGNDPGEYRAGFIELVRRAQAIKENEHAE